MPTQNKTNYVPNTAPQKVSASNDVSHGSSAKGPSEATKPGPTLTEIQQQSGTAKGSMERWKQQTESEKPWTPTGKRSLGDLGSFVGYHAQKIEEKKG